MATQSTSTDADRPRLREIRQQSLVAVDGPSASSVTRRRLRQLRQPIKDAVHAVVPDAEVILYGSRARGDAQVDSDWDLLVLVDGALDVSHQDEICHRIYRVEREWDEVLCPIVMSREDWAKRRQWDVPFYKNVERDGVRL